MISAMNEQLLGYLFDEKPHLLTGQMAQWLGASRRFKVFMTSYRNKIRKKIRITQSESAIEDLRAELAVGYWLVRRKRFTVTYEPYGSEKTRGPDFGVGFKSMTFNVEVTRIHPEGIEQAAGEADLPGFDSQQAAVRLMDTVCDKLGQMRPGMVNVLLVVVDETFGRFLDIEQAMTQLKDRAERKDEGLFGRYGYVKSADFFKYFLRLSGIVVWIVGEEGETAELQLWENNQTKHNIPGSLKTILQRG